MKYNVGDRVAFMSRKAFCLTAKWTYRVGFIKQVNKTLFGTRYVICVAKSDELDIVSERHIFNKIERKEKNDERTDTRI